MVGVDEADRALFHDGMKLVVEGMVEYGGGRSRLSRSSMNTPVNASAGWSNAASPAKT
jgi:hypothetical protein